MREELKETAKSNERYKNKSKTIQHSNENNANTIEYLGNDEFEGIINFLRKNSNIKKEINITYSSNFHGVDAYRIIEYENINKYFVTNNEKSPWIGVEFKNHEIIPTNYTIRSNCEGGEGYFHPMSWVIEGLGKSNRWEILSEIRNTTVLDGSGYVHTFSISVENQKKIKSIRIRQTDFNSDDSMNLMIGSFEVFGKLI